jgi:hypothetical protein
MSDFVKLPDGSSFGVMSLPLPSDHWLYAVDADGFSAPPPMPMRMGTDNPRRYAFCEKILAAARYAVKASTMNGKEPDFDPDALVQNMVVGLLGYFTPTGLGDEKWMNPSDIPEEFNP